MKIIIKSFENIYDEGCYSYVGRKGGGQEINLPTWCTNSFGSLLHEMYHALGFLHEQSRSDRDAFVDINWDNIEGERFTQTENIKNNSIMPVESESP
ncbi:Zinc metalloproteinase nas-4 [Armadillidium vulgare]|nr:Zinc metalloproteinase nas-4 [Armadillidium vulgare]